MTSVPRSARRRPPARRPAPRSRPPELRIPRALLDELIERADASPRAEICGLIAGRDGVATRLVPVTNVQPDPERAYEMDPNDQHRALTEIEDAGEDLIGMY